MFVTFLSLQLHLKARFSSLGNTRVDFHVEELHEKTDLTYMNYIWTMCSDLLKSGIQEITHLSHITSSCPYWNILLCWLQQPVLTSVTNKLLSIELLHIKSSPVVLWWKTLFVRWNVLFTQKYSSDRALEKQIRKNEADILCIFRPIQLFTFCYVVFFPPYFRLLNPIS